MDEFKKKMLGTPGNPETPETPQAESLPEEKRPVKKKTAPKDSVLENIEVQAEAEHKVFRLHMQDQARSFYRTSLLFVGGALILCLLVIFGLFQWMMTSLKPQTEKQIEKVHQRIEERLQKVFDQDSVQQTVSGQLAQMTDAKIRGIVSEKTNYAIVPVLEEVRSRESSLNARMERAVDYLDEIVEFSHLTADARNDNRKAFERLLGIAGNQDHVMQASASKAVAEIYRAVQIYQPGEVDILRVAAGWREDMTLEQFKSLYQESVSVFHAPMLVALWKHKGFSKFEKLDFTATAIRDDVSLRALNTAMKLMDQESDLRKPLTEYERYLDWWREYKQRAGIQKRT